MSIDSQSERNTIQDSVYNQNVYHTEIHNSAEAHMKESIELAQKLKLQTKELQEINKQLGESEENYKTITQKVSDTAREHPVPGKESDTLLVLSAIQSGINDIKDGQKEKKQDKKYNFASISVVLIILISIFFYKIEIPEQDKVSIEESTLKFQKDHELQISQVKNELEKKLEKQHLEQIEMLKENLQREFDKKMNENMREMMLTIMKTYQESFLKLEEEVQENWKDFGCTT